MQFVSLKSCFQQKAESTQMTKYRKRELIIFSDHLGIVKEEVIKIINLLREEKILADTKDLTAFYQAS